MAKRLVEVEIERRQRWKFHLEVDDDEVVVEPDARLARYVERLTGEKPMAPATLCFTASLMAAARLEILADGTLGPILSDGAEISRIALIR